MSKKLGELNSIFTKSEQQTEELHHHIIVLVTCPNKKVSEQITEILLEKRLAACVNIIANVSSHYLWKGKKESSKEVLMIIKTRTELFERLAESIIKNHPYDLPEIIALPIVQGSVKYLKWIDKETRRN